VIIFGNINVFDSPIPVHPSAHYTMGGIPCNILGEVLPRLYAVGETACVSVHGANRLGCNSLLELVVFGQIVGRESAKIAIEKNDPTLHKNIANQVAKQKINILQQFFNKSGEKQNLLNIKQQIKLNNEKTIGIFRDKNLLQQGIKTNTLLYLQLKNYSLHNKSLIWNNELTDYFETESLLLNSLAVAYSALQRTESRGSHYRCDFTNINDNFLHHSLVGINIINQEPEFNFSTKQIR
jgi:succinate dehydrogenase/fumarate reductase flavoprotein subunit